MVKIKGLQHIGILVPDVDAAAGWYTGKSGFRKKAEFMASGSRVIFVYSPESGVLCELIERPKGSGEAEEIEKMEAGLTTLPMRWRTWKRNLKRQRHAVWKS